MRVYHTTTKNAAAAILQGGWHDTTGHYGFVDYTAQERVPMTGVWFANRPLGGDEGAAGWPVMGDPVLVIELEEADIATYELTTFPEAYREWCIPALLATPHLLGVVYDQLDEAEDEAWWEDAEPTRHV